MKRPIRHLPSVVPEVEPSEVLGRVLRGHVDVRPLDAPPQLRPIAFNAVRMTDISYPLLGDYMRESRYVAEFAGHDIREADTEDQMGTIAADTVGKRLKHRALIA